MEQLPDLGFSHGLALLDPFRAILRMQGLCTAPYQGQTVGHVEGVALGDLEPKGGTAWCHGLAAHHLRKGWNLKCWGQMLGSVKISDVWDRNLKNLANVREPGSYWGGTKQRCRIFWNNGHPPPCETQKDATTACWLQGHIWNCIPMDEAMIELWDSQLGFIFYEFVSIWVCCWSWSTPKESRKTALPLLGFNSSHQIYEADFLHQWAMISMMSMGLEGRSSAHLCAVGMIKQGFFVDGRQLSFPCSPKGGDIMPGMNVRTGECPSHGKQGQAQDPHCSVATNKKKRLIWSFWSFRSWAAKSDFFWTDAVKSLNTSLNILL